MQLSRKMPKYNKQNNNKQRKSSAFVEIFTIQNDFIHM